MKYVQAVVSAEERGESEGIVAQLERLVALLATAPHLSHLLPPAERTASLLATSTSEQGDVLAHRLRGAVSCSCVMVVRVSNPEDLEPFTEFMRNVDIRVWSDERRFVALALTKKMATPSHEERELLSYVQTWNAIRPLHKVTIL